jgi:hypothetical protein
MHAILLSDERRANYGLRIDYQQTGDTSEIASQLLTNPETRNPSHRDPNHERNSALMRVIESCTL